MLGLRVQIPLMARGTFNPVQPESLEAIAGRLLALRKALGASQIQMAQTLGSPSNSLWANYEGGTRRKLFYHNPVIITLRE